MVKFEPRQAEVYADLLPERRHSAPLYVAAEFVIEAIGEDAASYATARADLLYRKGDFLGAAAWRRVTPLIEELQRRRRMSAPQLILAAGRRDGQPGVDQIGRPHHRPERQT
jgi:hypothetical protein